VLTARFSLAKLLFGSTVPRKMALYWFMPALGSQ
jgi:hypothetical protein